MLIGGIRTPSDALVGPLAVQALASLHLDQVFLGVHGMTERAGYTTPNLLEADTNRAFVEASQRLVVVADHSKWNTVGLASIAPLDAADTVVTDDGLDRRAIETLRAHVDDVIVCSAVIGVPIAQLVGGPGGDRARAAADGAGAGAVRRRRRGDRRRRRRRGCGRSTGRGSSASARSPARRRGRRCRRRATSVDGWDEVAVPSSWVLPADGSHDRGAPIYLNVRMPFAGQAPYVPADNPTGVYRREFSVPARVAPPAHAAARRVGELDGLRVGQRRVRRVRHRQPPAVDVRHQRPSSAAARTRCASSCRGGARRRGSRTRTSGGCPGCTAASSWCRCRRSPSATRRRCPGSSADGTTGTLDLDVGVDVGAAGARAADRRGRRHRPARPAPRARSPRRARSTSRAGRRAMPATSTPRLHLAGPPGASTGCACRASRRGTTRRRGATASSIILRDGGGTVLDVRARWVGFRRVELADRALLVNGVAGRDQRRQPPRHPSRPRPGDDGRRHAARPRADEAPPRQRRAHVALPEGRVVLRPVRRARPVRRRRGRHRDPRPLAGDERRPGLRRARSSSGGCAWCCATARIRASSPGRSATSRATGRRTTRWRRGSAASTRRGRCTTRAGSAATSTPPARCPTSSARCTPRSSASSQWSADGRDRRPLILCEYNHAMGQAGGLADYWAVFGDGRGAAGRVRVGVGRPRAAPPRGRRHDVDRLRRRLRRGRARRQLRVRRAGVGRPRAAPAARASWRR